MAVGEDIETVLSLLSLFPSLPMAVALSAAHLAALRLPRAPARRRGSQRRSLRRAGRRREEADAGAVGRCR
jgi:hypothetical protein